MTAEILYDLHLKNVHARRICNSYKRRPAAFFIISIFLCISTGLGLCRVKAEQTDRETERIVLVKAFCRPHLECIPQPGNMHVIYQTRRSAQQPGKSSNACYLKHTLRGHLKACVTPVCIINKGRGEGGSSKMTGGDTVCFVSARQTLFLCVCVYGTGHSRCLTQSVC